MTTHSEGTIVITPTQVEEWISGVRQIKIVGDDMVSVFYENGCQISARLEYLPHAIQSNFFALVRRVQAAAQSDSQKSGALRLA
jgi:hypothetical protein